MPNATAAGVGYGLGIPAAIVGVVLCCIPGVNLVFAGLTVLGVAGSLVGGAISATPGRSDYESRLRARAAESAQTGADRKSKEEEDEQELKRREKNLWYRKYSPGW